MHQIHEAETHSEDKKKMKCRAVEIKLQLYV